MRKILPAIFFLFFICFTASSATVPVSVSPGHRTENKNPSPDLRLSYISSLKIKQVEKLAGRKLTLKEKIGFKIIQWKIRKETKQKKEGSGSNKGKTAMILGIVGIGLLFIPYLVIAAIPCAILAIIFGNQARKINHDDGKAKAGVILGWVTLGLFVLALILAIVILASWGGLFLG